MLKEEKNTPLTAEEETLVLVRKLWRAEKWPGRFTKNLKAITIA